MGDFAGHPFRGNQYTDAADAPKAEDYRQDMGGIQQYSPRHGFAVDERFFTHEQQHAKTTPGAEHPVLMDGKTWVRRVAVEQIDNGVETLHRYTARYKYLDAQNNEVNVEGRKLRAYDATDAALHRARGGTPKEPPAWLRNKAGWTPARKV